jgi:hypothetical protein
MWKLWWTFGEKFIEHVADYTFLKKGSPLWRFNQISQYRDINFNWCAALRISKFNNRGSVHVWLLECESSQGIAGLSITASDLEFT